MKKSLIALILIVTFFSASSLKANAQPYGNAVGLQVGSVLGVNFKSFLTHRGALEADVSYYVRGGVMGTLVYQHHFELVDNFNLYLGGGVNIGAVGLSKGKNAEFALGVDPNLGFEYSFDNAPIALGFDYRPMINFTAPSRFDVLSFRVRFRL